MVRESLDKNIDEVSREKNKFLSYCLNEYSLGNGQFQILNEVAWNEGISQEGIARNRKTDKSAVAKSIKKLIENDYVYKVRDENDKRAFRLYCTEKGNGMIPIIEKIVGEVDSILTKGSTNEEIKLFWEMLLRMKGNIDLFFKDSQK